MTTTGISPEDYYTKEQLARMGVIDRLLNAGVEVPEIFQLADWVLNGTASEAPPPLFDPADANLGEFKPEEDYGKIVLVDQDDHDLREALADSGEAYEDWVTDQRLDIPDGWLVVTANPDDFNQPVPDKPFEAGDPVIVVDWPASTSWRMFSEHVGKTGFVSKVRRGHPYIEVKVGENCSLYRSTELHHLVTK